MHNGSLMRMINLSYGRGIEIRYVEPRPGLADIGVREGTSCSTVNGAAVS